MPNYGRQKIQPFAFLTSGPDTYVEAYYVGNQYLGRADYPWIRTNGGRLAFLDSTAFFCPSCGEIWARRICKPSPNGWSVHTSPCQKHGGGSLLRSSYEESSLSNSSIPLEWFRYEVNLRIINDEVTLNWP